ncbi:MAG TPA: type II toxin-antitoxin system HicA family toxin [Methylococcaceae bacterium]|nr:type II toxin-antitoxin system HicA family toxin [Methylococcaceae bacterium]
MRLPRDFSGADLAKRLERLGYQVTRRTGSHMRLTFADLPEHHLTIPNHESLRVGTLAAILQAVAARHGISRDELTARLFA